MYALGIAATGLEAAQKVIDVTANNIANADSIAFKKFRVATTDLQYYTVKNPIGEAGALDSSPGGIYLGHGSKVVTTQRMLQQGALQNSTNPLHIAISGLGYFGINLGNGVQAFTRLGNFMINKNRKLVTSEGAELGEGITIPDNVEIKNIKITPDGGVNVTNRQGDAYNIGQIKLYAFPNEDGLKPQSDGLLVATEASGEPIEYTPNTEHIGQVLQSYLEQSNTNPSEEMIHLIKAQKVYEMNIRVMKVADNIMQSSIDLVK